MTAQAFLLNSFSMDSGHDGGEQSCLSQHFLEGMLRRCGIHADWIDELTWMCDKSSQVDDYLLEQNLPAFCWHFQPELDFTLLAAGVHKIACGNGHMLVLAHQSGGAIHGCVLVSPAAAGRFNLLPAAELSTFYVARRQDAGTVTVDEQVMKRVETAGIAREEIHSVLLAGTIAGDDEAVRDRWIPDCQKKPVLQYLAEMTAGYSGSDNQIDVILNRAGNIIKSLMVMKKL